MKNILIIKFQLITKKRSWSDWIFVSGWYMVKQRSSLSPVL